LQLLDIWSSIASAHSSSYLHRKKTNEKETKSQLNVYLSRHRFQTAPICLSSYKCNVQTRERNAYLLVEILDSEMPNFHPECSLQNLRGSVRLGVAFPFLFLFSRFLNILIVTSGPVSSSNRQTIKFSCFAHTHSYPGVPLSAWPSIDNPVCFSLQKTTP
jgi:hypothetical protein